MHRSTCLSALVMGLVLGIPACGLFGGPSLPSSLAEPPEYVPPGGQTKCKVWGGQLNPLIVEWSAADRAALEVLAQRGTVAVRYAGCELEILPRCRAPGIYHYVPTNRKTERVIIDDEDELYTNLPTGAVKLEGKLQRAGQLDVNMNVVGQFDNDQLSMSRADLTGDCSKATHYVTGFTVGAFEFGAGGGAEVSGEASALGAGVGARTSSRRELLSSDGEVVACEQATLEDAVPPIGCGALLRISLVEFSGPEPVQLEAVACPAGTTLVAGQCVGDPKASVPVRQSNPLHVRVSCGVDLSLLGEQDGLKVWVDGQPVPALEEVRAYNAASPGSPGVLQYVVYQVEPGQRRVRIDSDSCDPVEQVLQVKPGVVREVAGRLRPNHWYQRPPAGSSAVGIGLNYQIAKFEHVTLKDNLYEKFQVSPDGMSGFGFEFPVYALYGWASLGLNRTKGNLPFHAPACRTSDSDCLVPGTPVNGKVSVYNIPILLGPRLPFVYGSAMVGTGFEFNAISIDGGEADSNISSTSSDLAMHVPVLVGLELRPFCNLALTARASRGFSLSSDTGAHNSATISLAYLATYACADKDFGIQ